MYAHVMIMCVLVLSGCSVTTPSFCVRVRVLGYITLDTHAYHQFPIVLVLTPNWSRAQGRADIATRNSGGSELPECTSKLSDDFTVSCRWWLCWAGLCRAATHNWRPWYLPPHNWRQRWLNPNLSYVSKCFFLLPSAATWTTTSDLTLGWTVYAGALGSLRSCLCVAATTNLTLGSLSAAWLVYLPLSRTPLSSSSIPIERSPHVDHLRGKKIYFPSLPNLLSWSVIFLLSLVVVVVLIVCFIYWVVVVQLVTLLLACYSLGLEFSHLLLLVFTLSWIFPVIACVPC